MVACCVQLALSPGYSQILSHSRGEKSGSTAVEKNLGVVWGQGYSVQSTQWGLMYSVSLPVSFCLLMVRLYSEAVLHYAGS